MDFKKPLDELEFEETESEAWVIERTPSGVKRTKIPEVENGSLTHLSDDQLVALFNQCLSIVGDEIRQRRI